MERRDGPGDRWQNPPDFAAQLRWIFRMRPDGGARRPPKGWPRW